MENFELSIDQQADKLQEYKDGLPDTFVDYRILVHASSMDDMDIDGADDAIEKLSSYKLPGQVEAEFDELRSAVSRLDQDAVAQIIERIVTGMVVESD